MHRDRPCPACDGPSPHGAGVQEHTPLRIFPGACEVSAAGRMDSRFWLLPVSLQPRGVNIYYVTC